MSAENEPTISANRGWNWRVISSNCDVELTWDPKDDASCIPKARDPLIYNINVCKSVDILDSTDDPSISPINSAPDA